MVCSLGSGKMAVMARLLAAGSISQTIAEEVGHQKLATQSIYKELREADEANLLDEEDMHVFGLMPMTDPLHLVCCNACKKPVKASQYVAHAELCRSLNSAEEMALQHDGGVGHRKPPRKERKKLLTAYTNQSTPVGEQERFESIDADDATASETQLDGQHEMPSSFFTDIKRNSVCVGVASMMDGKGVSSENTGHSASVMPPPTKRSKHTSSQHQPLSDDPETASGLTKNTSTQDPLTYTPVPLATKIYYSQRNNHLRSAVTHLYHVMSPKGPCSNVVGPQVSEESIMQLQASYQRDSSHRQADDLPNKREHSAHKPNQILAQSSEVCLDKLGGCVPVTNFSNQFPADSILRPQTAPVGLRRSKYIPKPYSFAGNSGKSLGTVQQANGSVPVL